MIIGGTAGLFHIFGSLFSTFAQLFLFILQVLVTRDKLATPGELIEIKLKYNTIPDIECSVEN